MSNTTAPKTIEDLKKQMKALGVSEENNIKFQDEIDDADHDIESIKEDISDREQSMLVDFFRDELKDEKIYDIVKSIMDGTSYKAAPDTINKPPQESKKDDKKLKKKDENNSISEPYLEQKRISDDIKKSVSGGISEQSDEEEKKEWNFNKEEKNGGDGTVILNAGLIIIPDEVITKPQYLENIDGITYVLYYNNCGLSTGECRLPYSYIEFWKEYLNEETPNFKTISDDIEHNEGPTYDYLMEHPPNDRILPVLEKVVDQLKYPQLDSTKEKRRKQIYTSDIQKFFKQQAPEYAKIITVNVPSLIKTCVLFKTNTNDTNFNTFELFINMMDIYDRIIFNSGNKIKPMHITGTEWKSLKNIKGHFAALLDEKDYLALNTTMVDFKHAKKASFFPRLEFANGNNKMLINDNLEAFQMISLSFMLFIKSFMCETGNCLEKGNHIYKAPRQKGKNRKKQNKNAPFVPIIKSLIEIKSEKTVKNNNNKSNGMVDDNDIFFHNDNMPLQFDLCIIPKENGHKDFGLITEHKEFEICCASYKTPTNKQEIYKLYGQLIDVFRKTIKAQKNKSNIQEQVDKKDKKPPKRRDDRYCIVFDRHTEKFYIYPPHIKNGGGNITHRKSIQTNKQEPNKSDASVDKNKNNNNNNNNNDIDNGEEVDNEFSLISHEYNDLTNFYLTNKCIIPSKTSEQTYYGLYDWKTNGLQFVLSAHFHKQRQWHRHPKLRLYQYFNGGGLRFFHSNKDIKRYKCDRDIIDLWPQYFVKNKKKSIIDDNFINKCNIFDAVLDLYKCDAQYFQWDNAVKRQLKSLK